MTAVAFPALPVRWTFDGLDFNVGLSDGVSRIVNVSDWDSPAPGTPSTTRKPTDHGLYRGPNYVGGKDLAITGWSQVETHADRQAEIDRLAGLAFGADDLFALVRFDEQGQPLTLWCERSDRPIIVPMPDGVTVKYSLPLLATDPFKYSDLNPTQSTPLPSGGTGGIAWNGTTSATGGTGIEWNGRTATVSGLVYQTGSGISGIITLTNSGNAPAPILFTIAVAAGGSGNSPSILNNTTGERITFGEVVQAGSNVTINTQTGEVLLDGIDRGGSLTDDDLFLVPEESSIDISFSAGPGSSNVTLSATNANVYA